MQEDFRYIQGIRERWNELPLNDPLVEQLQPYADGGNLYQLWLEARLMYAERWKLELEYRILQAAKECGMLRTQNEALAEQVMQERAR
jgi:hypothetical protein